MPTLNEYAETLKPALEEADAELKEAESEVEAARKKVQIARDKRHSVERAIAALRGGDRSAGTRSKRIRHKSNDWTPRESTLTSVREAIKGFEAGFTEKEIIDTTQLSDSTVNRAIHVLREKREVRLAGKQNGTARNLYKPVKAIQAVPDPDEAKVG